MCPFSCKMEEYSIFKQIVIQSSEEKQPELVDIYISVEPPV